MTLLNVDCFIAPGLTHPAVKHLTTKDTSIQSFYIFIMNLFKFPAGAIPITHVQANE